MALLMLLAGCSVSITPSPLPKQKNPQPVTYLKNPLPTLQSPDNPNPQIQQKIEGYLAHLTSKGYDRNRQGVWIQNGDRLLGNYRGTVPLPSASIAKMATTLVALQTLGTDYRFITRISTTGTLQAGILDGDLVIEGGNDPFFVWEDAVEIGNLLNQLGIDRVRGNLLIVGKFYMNFQLSELESGNFLKQGFNAQIWTKEAEKQYNTLPSSTPRPQVVIEGTVQITSSPPTNTQPLLQHYSLPLAQLLKKMNCYSNTWMTVMLNEKLGGDAEVARKAADIANVPSEEIQLGKEDRISPRAAVGMSIAIQNYLQQQKMTVADVLAITGKDEGILQKRPHLPLAVLKSGIWEDISALAGALPTRKQETVWFAIVNLGQPYEMSEAEQEVFLNNLLDDWGKVSQLSADLQPSERQLSNQQHTSISRQ